MKLWRARSSEPTGIARKPPTGPERKRLVEESIPVGVEVAGQWSWRLLVIAGILVVFGLLIAVLRDIAIPFMVGILISALLVPFKELLMRHRWPKWLAVTLAMLLAVAVIGGLVFLFVAQVRTGLPDLQKQSIQAYDDFKGFLNSQFHITNGQINDYLGDAWKTIEQDSNALLSGALSVGSTAGHFIAGLLLTLFATLFIVIDGRGIWGWVVRLFPRRARPAIDGSGRAGWLTLTTFVRVQILVAAIDAVGIGLGAWILGLFYGGFPLLIPIAIAVFLGSFVPIIGAVVTGALAVFVALVYLGPLPAVIMLLIVLAVQEIEGHALQPFIMGTAVKVHPLAVVFAVAAGSFVAGIPGALFAVPIVAVLNVMITYIGRGEWRTHPRPQVKDVVSSNE